MKKLNSDIDLSDQQIVKELQRTAEKCNQRRIVKSFASSVIVVTALLILIVNIGFPIYYVFDHAMEPKLMKDQIVFTSRIWNYSAGDIAVIRNGNQICFRYIAAVPGDLIEVDKNGILLINGSVYEYNPILTEDTMSYPYQLPEDCYLTLSDTFIQSSEACLATATCIFHTPHVEHSWP